MTVVTIVVSIACFLIGGFASYLFFKHGLKSKYDSILKDAEAEAEVIKKNKLLEVKEKFLNKKADLEKEVAIRNQKIQQAENKLKQREMVLNQRHEELQRKKQEADAIKENLEAQLVVIDKKKEELDHLQRQEIEKLEAISGLSAEEAKEVAADKKATKDEVENALKVLTNAKPGLEKKATTKPATGSGSTNTGNTNAGGTTTGSTSTARAAKTGDTANAAAWLFTLAASAVAGTVVVKRKRED